MAKSQERYINKVNIEVKDKGGEKSEIKVSQSKGAVAKLSKVEHGLTDLKCVLKWSKDHGYLSAK